MDNPFTDNYEASIGVDFMSKQIKFQKLICTIQLWDSPGQEKYKGLIPSYIKGSSIVFLVYDISNSTTFDNIPNWIKFIRSIDNPILVLCGNMVGKNREIDAKRGEELAKREGLLFFEINSKTNENIKNMFYLSLIELPIFKNLKKKKEEILDELLIKNDKDYYFEIKKYEIKNKLDKLLNENIKIKNLYNKEKEKNKKLEKDLLEKENKIKTIEPKLSFELEENKEEKSMIIKFITTDENIHYSTICKDVDSFRKVEESFYKKYPQYMNYKMSFYVNSNKINVSKSLEENNIQNNDS